MQVLIPYAVCSESLDLARLGVIVKVAVGIDAIQGPARWERRWLLQQ